MCVCACVCTTTTSIDVKKGIQFHVIEVMDDCEPTKCDLPKTISTVSERVLSAFILKVFLQPLNCDPSLQ